MMSAMCAMLEVALVGMYVYPYLYISICLYLVIMCNYFPKLLKTFFYFAYISQPFRAYISQPLYMFTKFL